jgi:hypothetical protein
MILSGIGPTNYVLDLLLFVQRPMSQPLAQVKNGDQQFWKKRFHATNGKVQHALMMGPCFFFWGSGVSYYYYFFLGQICPYHQPTPKMVTNSFGNRSFM